MDRSLNLISLCSGAGALDIGVSSAIQRFGGSSRHVAYSERESAAVSTLTSRMEETLLDSAPVWAGDLAEFPVEAFRGKVDGFSAGFPCQPFSACGMQLGRTDDRNLLPLILQLADRGDAEILFLENVEGLRNHFDYILEILLQHGWNVEWVCLPACLAGASHLRFRWFAICTRGQMADTIRARFQGHAGNVIVRGQPGWEHTRPPGLAPLKSDAVDAPRYVGDGEGERNAGQPDRNRGPRGAAGEPGFDVGDHDFNGRCGPGILPAARLEEENALADGAGPGVLLWGGLPDFAPEPGDPLWFDILARWPELAPAIPKGALGASGSPVFRKRLAAESALLGVADGVASDVELSRADMLRITGNGVVWHQACLAYWLLLSRIATQPEC